MAGREIDVHMFKLVVVGDSAVGKSCCLSRFVGDSFTPSFIPTPLVDLMIHNMLMDDQRVSLQIWDGAGQERFRNIVRTCFRGAMGFLLVYDVTDQRSFHNIRTWVPIVDQYADFGAKRILIGNKCEWAEKRVVSPDQGQRLADELGVSFLEVSAKENINIEKAFYNLVSDIINGH